ncbi:MAG: hypothetical protein KDJ24_06535 [Gammaproteobacteria bacterium]|nr:hypothetical protein [Gammaproteobacteria bacterium]
MYQVLARPGPYRWLVSDDMPFRAGYPDSLFAANALDRARVVAAQDHGIAQRWDKASLCDYPALRDMIAAWHARSKGQHHRRLGNGKQRRAIRNH